MSVPSSVYCPPVVATVVVHEPGEWFAETLAGLAAQDYPALQHLFLLTGEASDPVHQPARDLIASALPGAIVRHLGANPGFGASCNSVLRLVEGVEGLFCFCHDDVALAPDAVSQLVAELYRSNAGVTGPKLVHWSDPRMIQSVGTAVDRLGVEMPLADDGEIDQEQHDHVQDVFMLSSACLLVRADLFGEIGGFDETLSRSGVELDFCWRVHLTGARVVVAPAAVARHRESGVDRDAAMDEGPAEDPDSVRLSTVLSLTSRTRLPAVVAESIVVGIAHAAVMLVSGQPRRAAAELRALAMLPAAVPSVARRRRRVVHGVADAEIRALQVRGSAHVVGYLRRRDHRRGVEQARATAEGATEVNERSSMVMWALLVACLLVGSRSLLLHGPAEVGQFVSLGEGPRSLFARFASGWWAAGFGQTGSVPTGVGITAVMGTALAGHMALLRTLVIVGAPLLGWLGVWRFASVLSTRAARVAATLAYAATPLAWTSIATGRFGGLVTYALFPWLAHGMRRLVGHIAIHGPGEEDSFGELPRPEWWRTLASTSLVAAVLFAVEPGALVVLGVFALVWSVVTLVHGARVVWSLRWTGVAGAVILAGILLNLPWAASYVQNGWWEALTGAPVEGGRALGLVRLLRFGGGGFHLSTISVLLFAPVVGAVLVVRGSRVAWALRGSVLAVTALLLALLDDKALLPVHLPEPAVTGVLVAFGIAVAAGSMGAGLNLDLRGGALTWRQPLGALVGLAFVVGTVPLAVNALRGDWNQPAIPLERLLSQLPDDGDEGEYRTVFVGDPRVLPGSPRNIGWGIAASVVGGARAGLEDQWEPVPTRMTAHADRAIRGIIRGKTLRAGRLLAPLGVRFVVVPLIDGGQSTRRDPLPEPRGLVDAVARQLDLRKRYASPDLAVFEVAGWVPVTSVLTGPGADAAHMGGAESIIATDLAGAAPAVGGGLADRKVFSVAGPGTVHLAVPYSDRWRLVEHLPDGAREQGSAPAFGLTNSFEVPARTRITVSYRIPWLRTLLAFAQMAAWVFVLWWSLPHRPGRRIAAARPEGGRQ